MGWSLAIMAPLLFVVFRIVWLVLAVTSLEVSSLPYAAHSNRKASSLRLPLPLSYFQQRSVRRNNKGVANVGENGQCYESTKKEDAFQKLPTRRHALQQCAASALTLASPTTTLLPSHAMSPSEASSNYDKYASTYDELDGGSAAASLGIDEARSRLLSKARGKVLEVGAGTGLNLSNYRFDGSDGITSLVLVDISSSMIQRAQLRVEELKRQGLIPPDFPVSFVRADATSSDMVDLFGHSAFDTVVDTFSLCVMGDQAKSCLEQLRNLVKPKNQAGQILLIENTRATNPLLGWYQDATAQFIATDAGGGKGCLYNQDVTTMILQTKGLDLISEDKFAAGLFRSFVCQKR